MAFSPAEWNAIQRLVNEMLTEIGEPFVQGKVVKNDPIKKLVWLKEFGDTPIPLIAFDYQVKYYDNNGTTVQVKKTSAYSKDVEILVPKVGQTVLVAQHYGTSRLPKCLGVVKSRNYVQSEGE